MKFTSAITRHFKKMLINNNGVSGLQICLVAAASMAVPSIFVHTVLSTALPAKPEVLSVCRAPQRALLPFGNCNDGLRELDNSDTSWKASPFVDAGVDTTSHVEGAASNKLKIQDEFTTGRIAGRNFADNAGVPDLSDVGCITFWIKSNTDLDDDILQLRLIDDNSDIASVNIDIPGNVLDGQNWKKVSAILSGNDSADYSPGTVALYAIRDPGAVTIWLDIIEGRKPFERQESTKSCLNELVFNHNERIVIAG